MSKGKQPSQQSLDAAKKAGARLAHLSMRYGGALMELVKEMPVGLIAADHSGFHECRDFINLILLTRAEINALTILLIRQGVLDHEAVIKQFAYEYELFAQTKAQSLGVEIMDGGLVLKKHPNTGNN